MQRGGSRAAILRPRLTEQGSCQNSALRMRMWMHLGRGKGPREADKSDGAGALRSLCCWKLNYPGQVLECTGSSAGAARREKWSQGVTTCILFLPSLPCSFPSSSFFPPSPSICSSSSVLPPSPLVKGPSLPLRPLPGHQAVLASTHQLAGTGVGESCQLGGSGRRWGVPGSL